MVRDILLLDDMAAEETLQVWSIGLWLQVFVAYKALCLEDIWFIYNSPASKTHPSDVGKPNFFDGVLDCYHPKGEVGRVF